MTNGGWLMELSASGLSAIQKKSKVQRVIESLAQAAAKGELAPGERLPNEDELALSYGVGRNTVREAVKILVSHEVLEIRHAKGTYVRNERSDIRAAALILTYDRPNTLLRTDWLELRGIYEDAVIRAYMPRMTASLRQSLLDLEEAADRREHIQVIINMFDALCTSLISAAGNPPAQQIYGVILSQITYPYSLKKMSLNDRSRLGVLKACAAMHPAMERRDGDAVILSLKDLRLNLFSDTASR